MYFLEHVTPSPLELSSRCVPVFHSDGRQLRLKKVAPSLSFLKFWRCESSASPVRGGVGSPPFVMGQLEQFGFPNAQTP